MCFGDVKAAAVCTRDCTRGCDNRCRISSRAAPPAPALTFGLPAAPQPLLKQRRLPLPIHRPKRIQQQLRRPHIRVHPGRVHSQQLLAVQQQGAHNRLQAWQGGLRAGPRRRLRRHRPATEEEAQLQRRLVKVCRLMPGQWRSRAAARSEASCVCAPSSTSSSACCGLPLLLLLGLAALAASAPSVVHLLLLLLTPACAPLLLPPLPLPPQSSEGTDWLSASWRCMRRGVGHTPLNTAESMAIARSGLPVRCR